MSVQNIYNLLRAAGATHVGACAIMGNMKAESGMQANIAQRGMTKLSDAEYTERADSAGAGDEARYFYGDSVGYGLCQWTYWSRKRDLLSYAQQRGTSVGDETTQVYFCIKELREQYAALWKLLCSTSELYEAVSEVCTKYERPADNNLDTRYYFAQGFMQLSLEPETAADDGTDTDVGNTEASVYWPPRMIQKGMAGPDVLLACGLLLCRGYAVDLVEEFDETLRQAVLSFQADKQLAADGVIGPKTWTALMAK